MLLNVINKINKFLIDNLFVLLVVCLLLFLFTRNGNGSVVPQYNVESTNNGLMVANTLSYDAMDSVAAPRVMMAKSAGAVNTISSQENSKLVKSFNLSIEVKNVEKAKNKVENKVKELNGLINNFNSYTYRNSSQLAYNFNLQIPYDKVDSFIIYLKELGLIKNESSSIVDMQETYVDNENRLKNLKVRRDSLRKMMNTKTQKLSDILAVDRELNNVQNEIESLERRNQKIDNDVQLSRVNLSLVPEVIINKFTNPQWQLSTSWRQAVNQLIVFGQKTVDYGLKILVFLPVIILVIFVAYFVRKKVIKKKA